LINESQKILFVPLQLIPLHRFIMFILDLPLQTFAEETFLSNRANLIFLCKHTFPKSSFRDQSLSSRFGQLADHIRLLILFTLCSPRVATFPIPGDTFSQGNALLAQFVCISLAVLVLLAPYVNQKSEQRAGFLL
jgi:hypothetical protein